MKTLFRALLASLFLTPQTIFAGSLNFSGNNSNVLNYGNSSNFSNLSSFTDMVWLKPTGTNSTGNGFVISKGSINSQNRNPNMSTGFNNNTFGESVDRSISDSSANGAGVNGMDIGLWDCFVAVFNANGAAHLIYKSSGTNPMYISAVGGGAGNLQNDDTTNYYVGNSSGTGTLSFPGMIGGVARFVGRLSPNDIQDQIWTPHVTSSCVLMSFPGMNFLSHTNTQFDLTGVNNGTVIGAVGFSSDGPPINFPMGGI